ncbi:uncharacterized protein A4U43_C09F3500 [Asparagus officinalis]|uniref:Peptidase C1A papain C-terminal domain-containing protein n=1 Tax=Asparagus officinalis TaxID=4686 RepID=A0A5P1E523_ASPOF|nr:uncharacterized protein A4U43_C09F3500 [Asparagus officinalis]
MAEASFPQGIPTSKDWSQLGVLNEVRDQGQCNCCWSIAACTCCEAKEKITRTYRPMIQLAPQDIINCFALHFPSYGDFDAVGCYSSSTVEAFEYIRKIGVMYERDCPFHMRREDCMVRTKNTPIYRILGYKEIKPWDEQTILLRVNYHPVTAVIDVTLNFRKLKAGEVYRFPGENTRLTLHSIVIVGWRADRPKEEKEKEKEKEKE